MRVVESGEESPKPLSGVRVLDLSRVLAGPLCTQMLGDLGADVIKVEPCEGDESRGWSPKCGDTGTAFLAVNRNKKSVTIDLKNPVGLDIVRQLAAISDVVVESNSTGVSDKLGVGFHALSEVNPAIVYCSISGFGREGPLKDAKGYDLMLQAFSGILDLTGEEGGAPARSPFSPIDQATGHHATIGILGALMRKMQTGKGSLVEVSLYESAMQFISYLLQAYWATGTIPTKVGCEHPSLVPYQPFQTKDRVVLIGIANDSLWQKFCAEFDLLDYVDDARFRTNSDRVMHRAETVALVQQAISHWGAETLLARLIEIGVPCAPINTIADIASHPQTAALGIVRSYEHPKIGVLSAVVQPIQFDRIQREAGMPPPGLGQDNREVLAMIGFDSEQIEVAFASGALGKQGPANGR
jgi:crotonobetainyl-CoA:carnitine CoA-transferase CaiB-like acyl-CoA transferase